MFGYIPRHDNRKLRLSTWFAHERDGDMQAFDMDVVVAGFDAYFGAVRRDRARRRALRATAVGG